jgi:hypothetical protein
MTDSDRPSWEERALRCGAGPLTRWRLVLREIAAWIRARWGTPRQRDRGVIR